MAEPSETEVLAYITSLLALAVALASAKYQKQSVDQQRRSVDMQRREHDRWMEEMSARAELRIRFEFHLPAQTDGTTVELDSGVDRLVCAFGLKNDGTRAATHVVLNVVAPRSVPIESAHSIGHPDGRPARGGEPSFPGVSRW